MLKGVTFAKILKRGAGTNFEIRGQGRERG